jgi:hypothetical protein
MAKKPVKEYPESKAVKVWRKGNLECFRRRSLMVKCPVCRQHEVESYDKLVCHLMQHKKADIVYAFLSHMQDVEVKLSKIETDIGEIKRKVEMLKEAKKNEQGNSIPHGKG